MIRGTEHRSVSWKPEDKHGYVIDGRELKDFAISLKVSRAHRIAYLLRSIASLLDKLAGQEVDENHLQLIQQVARDERHRQFRKLITKIITALREGGEKGRRASKLTITRYLEIVIDEPLSSTCSFVVRRVKKPT